MIRKLVLAMDQSDHSRGAAELAEAVAAQFKSEVLALSVREVSYSGAAVWAPDWTPTVEDLMDDIVGKLRERGLNARSEIREAPKGHAGQTITEAAKDWGADLIVVGSRGRSRLEGFVLGSVSNRVIEHAPCPVLIGR